MTTTPSRCYYWLSGDSLNVNLLKRYIKASRKPTFTTLYYDDLYEIHEDSHCSFSDIGNINKRKEKKKVKHRNSRHLITTNEYLKIMAKQCSLPDVQTDEEVRKPKQWRSETYFNASTPFRTKHIVNTLSLEPKKVPSKCLPMLEHPLTQAQLRIYRTQHSANGKGICHSCNSEAMFEVIRSVQDCHKKDSTEVKTFKQLLINKQKANKLKTLQKLPKKKEQCKLLLPLAGYTVAKRSVMLNGLAKMAQQIVPTNSLNTISQNIKYSTQKQKLAANKAKLQKPSDDLPIQHTAQHVKSSLIQETLPIHSDKEKDQKAPAKIPGLFSRGIKVPGNKLLRQLGKDLDPPPKLKTETIRTVTTQSAGVKTPLHKNTTAVKTEKGSPNKILIEKTKIVSSVQRNQYEKLCKVKDGFWTSFKGTLSQKEKINRGLIDYGISLPKNMTISERHTLGQVRKYVKDPAAKITSVRSQNQKLNETGLKSQLGPNTALETPLKVKTLDQKENLLRALVLAKGKTEEENPFNVKMKNVGFHPASKSNAETGMDMPVKPLGVIASFQVKTPPQKTIILGANNRISLTDGKTESEQPLITKTTKEEKPSITFPKYFKTRAPGFLTLLEELPPKPKEMLAQDNNSIAKTLMTWSKDNDLGDFTMKSTSFPEVRIDTQNNLTHTSKNEVTPCIFGVEISMRQFETNRNKKVVDFQAANKIGNLKETDSDQVAGTQMKIDKIEPNKSLPEPIDLTVKEKYIEARNKKPTRKSKIARQKESLKTLSERVVDPPNNGMISQNCHSGENADRTLPLALPSIPSDRILFEELPNVTIKPNDTCKNNIIPIVKVNEASKRRLFKLEPDKTARSVSVLNETNESDILKERYLIDTPIGDIPVSKNKASRKVKNKDNVAIQNILKPEDMTFGDGDSDDKRLEIKKNSTNDEYLKHKATSLYTHHSDADYMTSAQKSVLKVLSTYLERIEADLLSEFAREEYYEV